MDCGVQSKQANKCNTIDCFISTSQRPLAGLMFGSKRIAFVKDEKYRMLKRQEEVIREKMKKKIKEFEYNRKQHKKEHTETRIMNIKENTQQESRKAEIILTNTYNTR